MYYKIVSALRNCDVSPAPDARELSHRYEASTTRSQYVSLVNLISSGHSFRQLASVVVQRSIDVVLGGQVRHAARQRGGRQVQVHLGQQVGLAAGLLEVRLRRGRQRGPAALDHLEARVLFLQRLLLLQQLLVSLFERRVVRVVVASLVVVVGRVGGVRQEGEGGVGVAARRRGGRSGRGERRARGGARGRRRRRAARGQRQQLGVALGHGRLGRVLAARAHGRRRVCVAAAGVRVQAPQRRLAARSLRRLRECLQLV